jgi:hypothetical protein
MNKQEFEVKMTELCSQFDSIVTREQYEVHNSKVNALTDAYIAANKVKRCTKEQDHAMATLVASWG